MTTTQPWQEEFRKYIKEKGHYCDECGEEITEKDVLAFISTLISKERADERAKTIKECVEVYNNSSMYDDLVKAIENLK